MQPTTLIWKRKSEENVIKISGDWDDGLGFCGVSVHHVNRYQMSIGIRSTWHSYISEAGSSSGKSSNDDLLQGCLGSLIDFGTK